VRNIVDRTIPSDTNFVVIRQLESKLSEHGVSGTSIPLSLRVAFPNTGVKVRVPRPSTSRVGPMESLPSVSYYSIEFIHSFM
jgi:hypothetical protein